MGNDKTSSPQDFISEVEQDQGRACVPNVPGATELAAQTLATNEDIAKKLSARDKKTDIWLKWVYGIATLLILVGWEVFVICFSWKQLNPCDAQVRAVSDGVMIALWTSATANIVALPAIILNYLFPKRNDR